MIKVWLPKFLFFGYYVCITLLPAKGQCSYLYTSDRSQTQNYSLSGPGEGPYRSLTIGPVVCRANETTSNIAICSDFLPAMSVSVDCSVNGEPYTPGMRVFGGGHLSLIWQNGPTNNSGRSVIDSFPFHPSVETNSSSSLGVMYFTVSSAHGILLPGSLNIDCVVDTSRAGVPYTSISAGEVVSMTGTINVTSQNGISVSPPPPMVGVPGREVKSSFTVSTNSIASVPFSWDVSAPCSNWNPYLKVNGSGEAIGVGEVGIGSTLGRETPVTAYFSPTALGNFSCPATMTFYID